MRHEMAVRTGYPQREMEGQECQLGAVGRREVAVRIDNEVRGVGGEHGDRCVGARRNDRGIRDGAGSVGFRVEREVTLGGRPDRQILNRSRRNDCSSRSTLAPCSAVRMSRGTSRVADVTRDGGPNAFVLHCEERVVDRAAKRHPEKRQRRGVT